MSDWKPISTAPFDTVVLVYTKDEGVVAARGERIKQWVYWSPQPSSYESEHLDPTHWQPLPKPPTDA